MLYLYICCIFDIDIVYFDIVYLIWHCIFWYVYFVYFNLCTYYYWLH